MKRDRAVHTVYVRSVNVGEAARRQFITLNGYGARRMRKRSFGRFSIARTTRFIVSVLESQREMHVRRNMRERINTVSAPARDAP